MTDSPYREIPLKALRESAFNPRKNFNVARLAELTESIRQKGVLEPIIVRPSANGAGTVFEIVAGARRFRATRDAGLETMPAIVRTLDDQQAREYAIIENVQRENVHELEEAAGYRDLMEGDPVNTPAVVAAKVGKPESHVYRRLKLLSLIPQIQRVFEAEVLTVAHAERLARLTPELQQRAFDEVCFSPMFRYDDEELDKPAEDRIPNRESLEPLGKLDQFIQKHTAVDVDSEDARQYFPELQEQIQEAIESDTTGDGASKEGNTLLSLSESTFVRKDLGITDNKAPVPLPRGRWVEIERTKDACDNVQAGVVVHGGPLRVVNVCATKGCPKHFPPPKKRDTVNSPASVDEQRERDRRSEEDKKRAREEQEFKELLAAVAPAIAKHTEKVKLTAGLVRTALQEFIVDRVEKTFGVKLTDATAAQVIALSTLDLWNRKRFAESLKPTKFNLEAFEKQRKDEAQKAARKVAKAKPDVEPKAKAAKPAKPRLAKKRTR
jgi:ParB/RepB/Spo0J family partition protein